MTTLCYATCLAVVLLSLPVLAVPTKRQDSGSGTTDRTLKIWIPMVILALLSVVVVGLWGLRKRRLASAARTPASNRPTAGTSVTAEQLAGGTVSAPPRARRARRPRRTPSQMSTTSLPAYNKEPGDEELVIYRGPEDMQDASIAILMPPSEDDEPSESLHYREDSNNSSEYTPEPHTPHDQPLLDREEQSVVDLSRDESSADVSTTYLMPPNLEQTPTRPSTDTLTSSSEDHTSSSLPDPRGETPAYFEAIDPDTATAATAPPPERRRSRFQLFQRLGQSSPVAGDAQPTRGHRPSNSSGSGSMFRAISRQRSTTTLGSHHRHSPSNQFNSPSMISVNSISSPLTHTLVRTEFTYPRSGPTPDQLKIISSRESFSRFGMPYGADAIAYASSSRNELVPPPSFDDQNHLGNSGSSTSEPRRSRDELRITPNLADSLVEQLSPVAESFAQPPTPSAAPTSFNMSSFGSRGGAMSRASSMRSFATAAETLSANDDDGFESVPTTPIDERQLEEVLTPRHSYLNPPRTPALDEPVTPTMGPRHVVEGTDTTVTPATFRV